MAAYFELVDAPEGGYRVRLLNPAGQVVAVSVVFPTKKAATESIFQTREVAADAPIKDLSAPLPADRLLPGDRGKAYAGGDGRRTA